MMATFYKIFLYFFITGLFLLPFFSSAAQKALCCSICRTAVRGGARYWQNSKGKVFCSRECLEKSFPKCTICGCHTDRGKLAADHSFFACLKCAEKPRCFACQIPCDGLQLPRDRVICRTCFKDRIPDQAQAEQEFRKVRSIMKQQLFIGTESVIGFHYSEPEDFFRRSAALKDVGYRRHGLYENITKRNSRTGKILKRKNNIYILDNLPVGRFHIVAAHELAHEWQQLHYPEIRDLKIREGFAEYVAWRYAKLRKDTRECRHIEVNPDPVYGDGFRLFRKLHEQGGFSSVRETLQKYQKKGMKS